MEERTIARKETIFRVPKLLRESDQQFYTPSFVSIGLCHAEKSDLRNMATDKHVAYMRMDDRLSGHLTNNNRLEKMAQERGFDMISAYEKIIVDEFKREHEDNRAFYDHLSSEDCEVVACHLIITDACFLFEFLVNYLKCIKGKEVYERWVVRRGDNRIFNSWIQNPTWHGIVYDLLLLENQVPLFSLTVLSRMGLTSLSSSVDAEESIIQMMWDFASLNHYGIFTWLSPSSSTPTPTVACHLLHLFYCRTVGSNLQSYQEEGYPWDESQSLISMPVWFESQSFIPMPVWFQHLFGYCKSIYKHVLTRFFKQCSGLVRRYIPSSKRMDEEGFEPLPTLQILSAAELKRAGVKLRAVRWKRGMKATPIRYIRFDERNSTLYLPEVRVDLNAQSLLRNFIALELTSDYNPRPITNFALFMDELINSEEDVVVLRKAGILRNFGWSNAQLANNFNGLGRGIPLHEGCKVVDEARQGLQKYLTRRYKILWNEFKSTYFAKPWLFLGSFGAVLLLVMTMIQVICLFYTCNG